MQVLIDFRQKNIGKDRNFWNNFEKKVRIKMKIEVGLIAWFMLSIVRINGGILTSSTEL